MGGVGRGTLRIYLGAAPGVGKTYAALDEARRRLDRGTDVVIGLVETHGRRHTAAMVDAAVLAGMAVVPRRSVEHRGASFTELDLDAVLARAPKVAVVDELAHTNVPGSRNDKRWQDVQELLAAGIDVISTVNVQHLESLNDVVETITGVAQRETVPDEVVRQADQVELVDMAPEALRRRMAHGNIYTAERVDAALANYFRPGNLTALRELALLWLAGKVDDQLDRYRAEHRIAGVWETRERVVVALTGGPEGDTLIRRAARIAARARGADLLAVHVARSDGLTGADPGALGGQRRLVESLGGTFHQVVGEDVPAALLDFARASNATQLVLGASRRSRLARILHPGIGVTTTNLSGPIDVHMVTHSEVGGAGFRLPRARRGLDPRRRVLAMLLTVALLPALTAVLVLGRDTVDLAIDILGYLIIVVAMSIVGGFLPALLCALASGLLLNYYFVPPLHRWSISDGNDALAIAGFVLVAAMVSRVVDTSAHRYAQAVRASAEAATLSVLAGSVLRGEDALPALLERARETFAMTSATLLERLPTDIPDRDGIPDATPDGALDGAGGGDGDHGGSGPHGRDGWRTVLSVGPDACTRPGQGAVDVPIGDDLALVLTGRPLPASDRRILTAFAAQAAVALERRRLAEAAAQAAPIAEADRVRTALLAAVSHDLRTPLAAAKASVTGLRDGSDLLAPDERDELLATADESLDRLTRLVENLLDLSRLQAGALSVFPRPIGLDDVIPHALAELGPPARAIPIRLPDDLPTVDADPALLERVLVNLAANALRHSPEGHPPTITASHLAGRVELRVVDHGPGIPADAREQVFRPFQRLGDRDNTTGVGLGLALARGLTEAMHGTLTPEDTPAGGLTMVISLPASAPPQPSIPLDGTGPHALAHPPNASTRPLPEASA
ncbi:sensor histidine kinase [Candidatus Frankia nodulisporulans]|uniref:sensor histidine kinase n=1 Tax=Candidatus Frankia nodulisporulans TaxID=2060052 RepID=UPI0013D64D53|nr:ATP-binding protein [Candidatus Frankia nodulisporulans]